MNCVVAFTWLQSATRTTLMSHDLPSPYYPVCLSLPYKSLPHIHAHSFCDPESSQDRLCDYGLRAVH